MGVIPAYARTGRGERLRAYLAALPPLEWGVHDCAGMVAGWVEVETGASLTLPRYQSRAEATAVIAAAGSLEALFAAEAARLGLRETLDPQLGDVGIVELSTGPVGCIFAHAGIAYVFADRGLPPATTGGGVSALKPREFLRAWHVPARPRAGGKPQ